MTCRIDVISNRYYQAHLISILSCHHLNVMARIEVFPHTMHWQLNIDTSHGDRDHIPVDLLHNTMDSHLFALEDLNVILVATQILWLFRKLQQ
jgi:hypothetical protein